MFQYRVLIVDLPFQLGRSREIVSVEAEFARAAPPIAIGGANAKNPSTQTQLPLLGVGFYPCTLPRRSRGACKAFLSVSLTYWQTKSGVHVGHCRRI